MSIYLSDVYIRTLYAHVYVEATSALDLSSEEAMYHLLNEMHTTYISVGHRPSLLRYHDSKLTLYGPGRPVSCTEIDAAVKERVSAESITGEHH